MKIHTENKIINIFASIQFLLMVLFSLSDVFDPINHITIGEVANKYKVLFMPAGYTFSIWILIYILLAIHVFYIYKTIIKNKESQFYLINRTGKWFCVASFFTVIWIQVWHYEMIELSLIVMLCILGALIMVNKYTSIIKGKKEEYFFVKLPFSVFLGWIMVATGANLSSVLVNTGLLKTENIECISTLILVIIGLIICIIFMKINRTTVYGMVFIWAYIGIMVEHISDYGFRGYYTGVIIGAFISVLILFGYIVSTKMREYMVNNYKH